MMSYFEIRGGKRLNGRIKIQGAKNSALPVLSAALLSNEQCVIHNCPELTDVAAAADILSHLGCGINIEGNTITVDSSKADGYEISDELMTKMRSSIVFLGAIIARFGRAVMSFPGGCELGPRPIDIHLSSLRQMGVVIDEEHGKIICSAPNGISGVDIHLPIPSVGATENIMLTAVAANGITTIRNAAREPEITDLADFLNMCGARIIGAGDSIVTVLGGRPLHGCEFSVIPDRIVAATYLAACAATGGRITIDDVIPSHLWPIIPVLAEAGCDVTVGSGEVTVLAPERLRRVKQITTMAYPGFPTDAQPPVMAMLTVAEGTSVFIENVFQNRYRHTAGLSRMGAKLKVEGRVCIVEGVPSLYGSAVDATDLRGGAAIAVAGLAAKGITRISRIEHILRGYEKFDEVLSALGADIKLIN